VHWCRWKQHPRWSLETWIQFPYHAHNLLRYLFGHQYQVKLPPVTTCLNTKGRGIPLLSALPYPGTQQVTLLACSPPHYPFNAERQAGIHSFPT